VRVFVKRGIYDIFNYSLLKLSMPLSSNSDKILINDKTDGSIQKIL